ncbi:carboxypeptidase regulatory-like domain-containing protein [Hymenobacter sp. BRD67]|uniref:carboxypeptidase regulatory-like domain-containing protein n=1 Tax=Hymenobacter sp. BRD67 TaxID=2675877 RepID=UPI001563A3BE|nr:carboxypeptidase regulatory-like domain-containing protein [Hymenobacter sp. BRD67]QKG53378.1 TonB-dependent receptor [Hymenobacter sp. BRD67]
MRTLTFGRTATRLTILLLLLLLAKMASAQVTTSAISGKISSDKNEDLIGVTVVATNVPTGTKRGTATETDGRFTIPNLSPGGPYTITVTYVGYKEQTINNVFLTLGNTTRLNFTLAAEAQALNEVVVVGNTQATKTGAGTNVGREQLQQLPTISRSIQDFTRLDPRNSNNSFAGSSFRYNNITLDGAINNDAIGFSPSLGGQGGTSGLPGGSARANPISLDAIQEIQAQVAPYDVKLGNFTGGSINAVTRSGTNDFHGSVYGYGRNQDITGKSVDGTNSKIGPSYHDYQTGFRLGGPIIKNKLFFFTNAELARRTEPQFYAAGAPGSPVTVDLAQQIAAKLNNYTTRNADGTLGTASYNVGDYGDYNIYSNSNKIFGRLDFNVNDKTSIALRHNYISAVATNLERSGSLFKFGSQDFTQNNVQNSTVLEVKSNFSNTLANNLILGYTNIHDYRNLIGGQANVFPAVQINNVGTTVGTPGTSSYYSGSNQILLGSDREASIFNQRQKTFELTDNVTFYTGSHAITVGTHNEFYHIDYGFINSWNGRIEYNSVNDFLSDLPSRIRGTYNNGMVGDNSYDYNYNNPSAAFNINFYSGYVQDEWTINDRLKITPGIRFDIASLPTKPALNSTLVNNPANDTRTLNQTYTHTPWQQLSNGYLGQVQISPRLGFNYDVNGDGSFIVRGGSGVFTGRVPFAWFGYAYYNNGVNFNSVDLNNIQTTPATAGKYYLSQNPNNIYKQLPASAQSTTEVNLIDNNFKMPQVWRSNLAFDFKMASGTRFSVEGLYTKTLQDVQFENINLADNVTYLAQGPTQSPKYIAAPYGGTKVNSGFSNAFFLTNTQQGYRYQLTGSVGQTLNTLLDVNAAYTYGVSKDISNGIRNSPQSNWELNPALNVNNPGLAYSNFDLRHRVVASINMHKSTNDGRFTGYLTSVLTYQSGAPYTWVYNNNFLGNGQQNVELAYIPGSASDIVLVNKVGTAYVQDGSGAQYTALNSFISNDPYLSTRRGQYAERNAARTPWNNQADVRLMVEAKLGKLTPNEAGVVSQGHSIQISFDIINFGNFLNNSWGRQYFVPNTFNSTLSTGLNQVAYADASGNISTTYNATTFNRPAFTFSNPATYSIDQLASRWQGQLGVRYLF